MTAAEREPIVAGVIEAANRLLRATLRGDAEAVLRCYTPNATLVDQGVVSPSFVEVAQGVRAFYAANRVVENALEDVRVDVLNAAVAVLTAHFRFASTGADGREQRARGAWTAVYEQGETGWKIAAAHQSTADAQA
jgi:uncharacterized protein (TIGR02246 family)